VILIREWTVRSRVPALAPDNLGIDFIHNWVRPKTQVDLQLDINVLYRAASASDGIIATRVAMLVAQFPI
jgi:hypothetical protein